MAPMKLPVQENGTTTCIYSGKERDDDRSLACDDGTEICPMKRDSDGNTHPTSDDHQSMDPPNTFEGNLSHPFQRLEGRTSSLSEGAVSHVWMKISAGTILLFLVFQLSLWFPSGTLISPKADLQTEHDLTMMMLGRSGAGKSATGNTILGRKVFRAEASPVSVTRSCQSWTETVGGRKVTIIDTPSVDMQLTPDQELQCIRMASPGSHAILLVFRLERFTEEDMNTVRWIVENFGEEALKYSMILFTGGDLLEGKPVKKFLNESVELQGVLQLFRGRYHVMDNREMTRDFMQVSKLLQKIDRMTYDNKNAFNISAVSLKVWRSLRTEHKESCTPEMERKIREEEEKIREEDKKKVREVARKRCLMRERDIREEEEWKRWVNEREIRREEKEKRRKMAEELEKQTKRTLWRSFLAKLPKLN